MNRKHCAVPLRYFWSFESLPRVIKLKTMLQGGRINSVAFADEISGLFDSHVKDLNSQLDSHSKDELGALDQALMGITVNPGRVVCCRTGGFTFTLVLCERELYAPISYPSALLAKVEMRATVETLRKDREAAMRFYNEADSHSSAGD